MVKWFFRHFSNLSHKVPSSSLSTFLYFGPCVFHFCRLAQTIPAFKAIVKVTNNYVCVHLDYLWNLGQLCCWTGHKYCKMVVYIYIIQFCVLNPFQTTQDTVKLLELPISQIFHALATQCSYTT